MKKEMLINVAQPEECRIAILEDGVLEELYVERTSHESYVGNIYKGRIVNIEPSIQAAFVDFGVGRNGFLHISDVEPTYYRHLEERRDRGDDRGSRGGRGERPQGRRGDDRGGSGPRPGPATASAAGRGRPARPRHGRPWHGRTAAGAGGRADRGGGPGPVDAGANVRTSRVRGAGERAGRRNRAAGTCRRGCAAEARPR